MCGSDSRDIAGFPVERFRDAIQPNNEQSAALDELARRRPRPFAVHALAMWR
jgi:hypothetical protein